jgi:RNA polymerase sigma factor (sigma-70 family)
MGDDAELLNRYKRDRDEAAFAQLVERYLPLVYSAALRRLNGDAHAAADITQQVFTALARQPLTAAQRRMLPAWLYATTRNLTVDFIRGETRRRRREEQAQAMKEFDSPSVEWERIRPLLDEALDELSRGDRDVVVLRFFAQRSFAEIGSKLGLTEDASRMRVDRALEKLRDGLSRRGVRSSSAILALGLTTQATAMPPAGMAVTVTGLALKSASLAAVPALGLVSFMSTSKVMVIAAGLMLLVGLGGVVYETRARRDAEVATREAAEKVARLQKQSMGSRQARTDAELRLSAAQAAAATSSSDKKSAPGSPVPDPLANGKSFLLAHPETTEVVGRYGRARTTSLYYELIQRLRLNPAQQEEFLVLAGLIQSGGVQWSSSEIKLGEQSKAELEARLHELLGDGGYAQYRDFDRELRSGVRNAADQLVRSHYFSATPLSPEQVHQLTATIGRNSADFQSGRGAALETLDWDNTMNEATAFLSAPQLRALTALREKAQFGRAMNEAVNRAVGDAKTAAGIPPAP